MCSPVGQLKRYQWVEERGWVGVYPDPANPGDEFCEILDYNFPVTYSQMVPELRPPDLEQGVGVEQDAGDAEDVLDDLDDSELNAVHDVLALSQHMGNDSAADPALQLVQGEKAARAHKRSQASQEQASNSRWGPKKQNGVVNNQRTLKTNKAAISSSMIY